jgi:hypothetical protein
MIKEIGEFILDRVNISYWVRDVNYFIGHLPVKNSDGDKVEVIDRVCVILENVPADLVGDLPDRQDKPIQIWNRNKSFFTAREDAYRFFNVLHGSSQWDLPVIGSGEEYTAMIIDGAGSPAPIENPDPKGRVVFSSNYMWRNCEK